MLAYLGNTTPALVVSGVFTVIGVIFFISGLTSRQKSIIDVITGIHDIRTIYVENQIRVNPLDTTDITNQYNELMGVDTSSSLNMLLSSVGVVSEIKDKKTDDVELQVSLVHAGKLMDRYNKGVDTLTSGDERYKELMAEYDKWCKRSKNSEKRMIIYNYLLESFGMNSQWLYIGSLMQRAPKEIMQLFPETFNTYMDGYKEYMKTYLGKWIDKYNELSTWKWGRKHGK